MKLLNEKNDDEDEEARAGLKKRNELLQQLLKDQDDERKIQEQQVGSNKTYGQSISTTSIIIYSSVKLNKFNSFFSFFCTIVLNLKLNSASHKRGKKILCCGALDFATRRHRRLSQVTTSGSVVPLKLVRRDPAKMVT